ncbi:MAG: hypothetical protein J0M37_04025 [Ignavibacteria bacterium]|nr:hypothetical protein [Ignavibacteria bacterium]
MYGKILILFFLCTALTFTQNYNRIDFEAGGFVLAQVPTPDGNTIYARTDVGGVYKKSGNEDWKFISEFAVTPGALMVQAIDINPNNPEEIIAACGMDYLGNDNGRGLWKSDNGGVSWKKILGPENGFTGVNYGGNLFRVKLGGPCARYHPSLPGRIITGTLKNSSGHPEIYMSDDNGSSWKEVNHNSTLTGNTVSIQIHPKYPEEIWIGTDEGLWITRDNGNTWSEKIFPGQIDGVYQILLKQNSSGGLTGFVTTGKLFRLNNDASSITELTGNFGYYSGYGTEIIGITFYDYDESKLFCNMMGYPAKISVNDGDSWGNQLEFLLEKQYNPKHTLETQDKIYTSNIITFQNPADNNIIYSSGGAGPFITTNKGKSWRFNGEGIDMTVVYDVTFSPSGDIYIPISDWGMARTDDKNLPRIINYSRNYTKDPPPPENNGDSYLPNVCRTLVSKNNPNKIYLIGGSVFTYYPAIAVSNNRGEPGSYSILKPTGILSYPEAGPGYDAILNDGDITTDGKNDILIVLMGGGVYNHTIYDASNPGAYWYGLYFSTNSGISFEKSVFTGEADAIYKNSIVSGLFNTTDYIEVDPVDPSIVYFYIEGGNESGVQAGGFFISTDYGRTFSFKNYIVQNPAIDYRNKGAIDVDPLGGGMIWAGIRNYGLFRSNNRGSSFEKLPAFTSVFYVDCKGNTIALFGMKDGDDYNKIYLSKDGGATWEHIYIPGHGVIPSVRSLKLRDTKDELWISTGGQGLFVYYY